LKRTTIMSYSESSGQEPIRIAVVEDDKTVREGLQMLLNGSPGFSCVAAYGNGEDAVAGLPEVKPDVVLMDINLPGINGIECIIRLKELDLPILFIMLTVFEDADAIFQSLSAGATGYLLKQTPPARLLEAIQDVYRGGSPMSGEIARKVVQSFQHPLTAPGTANGLTKREEEILSYLVKGFFYKEIANSLFISVETVRTHIRNIYEKLQVRTRSEAILKYLNK
jgi:DNA-binding NarL/FixJ family response regulator